MIKSTAVTAALSAMALASISLTACSQAAPSEEATGKATTAATLPDECRDHYLLAAMPEVTTIAGKALSEVSCQSFSITMGYGPELDRATIQLTDTTAPVTELEGSLAKMAAAGQKAVYDSTKMAIGLTKGMRQLAIDTPGGVEALGGEDYLAVITERPDGEIIIAVEGKDQDVQPDLMGLLKDRYVLNIHLGAEEVDGAAAAQAAYAPYLAALRLDTLP